MSSSTLPVAGTLLAFTCLTPLPALATEAPQWVRIGPYGGAVSALAAAPDVVYAGTITGSLFRSADQGRSWSFAGLSVQQIFALAVDRKAPDTVYAGTESGLFKTTDGGASWIGMEIHLPVPNQASQLVNLVVVDPRNPRIVWASFGATLYRTTNAGRTWRSEPSGPVSVSALTIDPTRSATVYAGSTAGGLFKTTDGGRRWSPIDRGLPDAFSATAIAVSPLDRKTLFVAGLTTPATVFKSTDGGATWTASSTGLGEDFVHTLVFDPVRPGDVYAATSFRGVWKSTNGGATWKRASAGLGDVGLSDLLATRSGLLAGADDGVFASVDRATTWQRSNTGMSALSITGLAVDRQDPPRLYAGSSSGALFKSASRGASWLALSAEMPLDLFSFQGPLAIDPHDSLTVYGLYTRGFATSTTGGRRWTATDLGCLAAARIVVDATLPTTIYANGFFVTAGCGLLPDACSSFRVDADGASCVRHAPLGRTGVPVLAADPHAPGTVFAVGPEGLYRSPDRGVTWSLLAPGIGPSLLAFDPETPGVVYGAFPGTVGRSGDGGATWVLAQESFPANATIVSIAFDPGAAATVYAAALGHGIWKSADAGKSWDRLAAPPAKTSFFHVVVDPADPAVLYVATGGASVLLLRQ